MTIPVNIKAGIYGVCRDCGAPREAMTSSSVTNRGITTRTVLVCPNGHDDTDDDHSLVIVKR